MGGRAPGPTTASAIRKLERGMPWNEVRRILRDSSPYNDNRFRTTVEAEDVEELCGQCALVWFTMEKNRY